MVCPRVTSRVFSTGFWQTRWSVGRSFLWILLLYSLTAAIPAQVRAQCVQNSSTKDIIYALISAADNGDGTFTYVWTITNNENGVGQRTVDVFFEIGTADTLSTGTSLATWSTSITTGGASPIPAYRVLRFTHGSGPDLRQGRTESFTYTLDASVGDSNVRGVLFNGHIDDLLFSEADCAVLSLLPVELVSFGALVDGVDVLLRWETASETNNAGFEIHWRSERVGAPRASPVWQVIGFVEGHGSRTVPQTNSYHVEDLDPGRHVFRLKQIDFDGTFEVHPEVEVVIAMIDPFIVESAYPNPFNPQAQFRFAVQRAQAVRVELYDMLGRRVRVLYEGEAPAGQMQVVSIHGSDLPSGLYLVRVAGKTFVKAQTVTLIK